MDIERIRERRRQSVYRRRVRCQIYLLTWFQEHPCVDCGKSDQRVLEADHRPGAKRHAIATLLSQRKLGALIEELKGCVARCVNCHRKKTAAERADKTTVAEHVITYLFAHSCVDCGEKDIDLLDLDHAMDKNIGKYSTRTTRSLGPAAYFRESEKSDVRCGNCHRIRHQKESGTYRTKTVQDLKNSLRKNLTTP